MSGETARKSAGQTAPSLRREAMPAVAAVIALFGYLAGLPVFDFVSEPLAPVSYAGSLVEVWMAAGVCVLLVLMRRHAGRIAETARVHIDEPSPTDPPQNGAVQL
ncbi:hypothetical protein [Streptomyces sp. UG1]|uniref:hypothetical protein n=1 Tax=Streptomyces sp. UG1 TaxID=3417652 RepID=UPI003CE790E8